MPIDKRPLPNEVRLRYAERPLDTYRTRDFAAGAREDFGFDITPAAPERPSEAARIAEAERLVSGEDLDGLNVRAGGSSATKFSFRDPHSPRKGWRGNKGGNR